MDFKDGIIQLSERIEKQKDSIQTEEATKNAFIMPMISLLGYDVFNPFEVVPEFTCDAGIKKGEKIDYAIQQDGKPIILMECKHCNQNLDLHDNQILRYFNVSSARFAILTNGIEYRFYTDLNKPNVMDESPFLVVNILDLSDNDIEQFKKFHKSYYNESEILSNASELQITLQIKDVFNRELHNPSTEFVKFFVKELNDGRYTSKQIEAYTSIVKKSMALIINEIIAERLNNAMKINDNNNEVKIEEEENVKDTSSIITTEDEIDSFLIIKNILRRNVDITKIGYKDNKNYFVIYFDKSWKWICRLYLNKNKYISFPSENGEEKIAINSLDDIYNFSEKLIESASKYI